MVQDEFRPTSDFSERSRIFLVRLLRLVVIVEA